MVALTTNEVISTCLVSLLQQGIPTGPISRALNIDLQLVKDIQSEVRVNKYGSAEIAELLQQLMFDAYYEARDQMLHGSPAAKTRMINMVLSRAMALVGRQSPEELDKLRNQLQQVLVDISQPELDSPIPSIYSDPDFTPTDEETEPPE